MSPVREVRELGQVMDRMSDTIQEFLHITHHISAESRTDLMLSIDPAGFIHEPLRAEVAQALGKLRDNAIDTLE